MPIQKNLHLRANILQAIRQFFAARNVLEVDTPLLSHATVTDPHVLSIPATFIPAGATTAQTVYLQTSPEYAMKRLLAAGSGSIYQICKAFRQGDLGRRHNPEFTMLEWYRVGFDHHALMTEVEELLQAVLNVMPADRMSYADVFQQFLGINPHSATLAELAACAAAQQIDFVADDVAENVWLDLLFTHCIETRIAQERPLFIYDFPINQAALAKIREEETPPVASRFEVYYRGMELANGFHELQDPAEQRKRFTADLTYRAQHALPMVPLDEHFLAALTAGLPDCAGVALGVDRLLMLAANVNTIDEVLSFGFNEI